MANKLDKINELFNSGVNAKGFEVVKEKKQKKKTGKPPLYKNKPQTKRGSAEWEAKRKGTRAANFAKNLAQKKIENQPKKEKGIDKPVDPTQTYTYIKYKQRPILDRKDLTRIILPEVIGKGYATFWNNRKRFLICKGSKGSKKSATAAMRYVHNIMKYPMSNLLVLRRNFNTHRDSTYAEFKRATARLGVSGKFIFKQAPLEIIYKPTGQKIMFRALEDPDKLASVVVAVGYLCWVWIEEAFEITNEEAFDKLNLSIRGAIPKEYNLWKEICCTFNPWIAQHWLKRRFFDKPPENATVLTTTYLCNEFLDKEDIAQIEELRETNPRKFRIVGLGEWGVSEGLVYGYREWNELDPSKQEIRLARDYYGKPKYIPIYGLDFGFTNSPTAYIEAWVNRKEKKIYIFDEHYQYGMTNDLIAQMLKNKGVEKKMVYADSAEPKSIKEIKNLGCWLEPCEKGGDRKRAGINKLQEYQIIVDPKCINTIIELNNYCWEKDKKTGITKDVPIKEFDHLMDALRYAMEAAQEPNMHF